MVAPQKVPDDLILTMMDPQGRTVWLTQERWNHVVHGHPEVRLADLNKAVETAEKRTRGNYAGSEKLRARNVVEQGGSPW